MSQRILELRPLRPEDEPSFLDALREFRLQTPEWDFALGYDERLPFAHYVEQLDAWSRGEQLAPGYVPGSFLVGVVAGSVVGRVSVRHQLNSYLAKIGGHIGYGVRPSQRRRGYATEMLRQSLPFCAAQGIDRALITCDVDNLASVRVIERCGGILESTTDDPELRVQKRRYWLDTRPGPPGLD